MATKTPAGRGGSRTVLLAAVVGGLLLVALVLVVTQREPAQLPADSPEATVQAFLQSVVDGATDTSLLGDDACPPRDDEYLDDLRLRAAVIDTTVEGDSAEVELEITEQSGPGALDDGYRHEETYRLRRTADGWRITDFDWPWPDCSPNRQEG